LYNYTAMKREFSAGGIVYKKEGGQIWWLVRRPKMNQGYRGNAGWSFPKGWVDGGEHLEEAALREVGEEGGVEARIIKKLPTLKVFFRDKGETVMKFITYFVMEWVGDLPEGPGWETEEVRWANLADSLKLLAYSNERELLKKAYEMVK